MGWSQGKGVRTMKTLKSVVLACVIALCAVACAACSSGTSGASSESAAYEVSYGSSSLYTQADMDAAIAVIMGEFDTWTGCTMKSIAFTDDATCEGNVEYANSLRKSDAEYDQAIVFTSCFHSPDKEQAEGTAWEPDTDYDGYTWTLARIGDGDWNLLTWGYA